MSKDHSCWQITTLELRELVLFSLTSTLVLSVVTALQGVISYYVTGSYSVNANTFARRPTSTIVIVIVCLHRGQHMVQSMTDYKCMCLFLGGNKNVF